MSQFKPAEAQAQNRVAAVLIQPHSSWVEIDGFLADAAMTNLFLIALKEIQEKPLDFKEKEDWWKFYDFAGMCMHLSFCTIINSHRDTFWTQWGLEWNFEREVKPRDLLHAQVDCLSDMASSLRHNVWGVLTSSMLKVYSYIWNLIIYSKHWQINCVLLLIDTLIPMRKDYIRTLHDGFGRLTGILTCLEIMLNEATRWMRRSGICLGF